MCSIKNSSLGVMELTVLVKELYVPKYAVSFYSVSVDVKMILRHYIH